MSKEILYSDDNEEIEVEFEEDFSILEEEVDYEGEKQLTPREIIESFQNIINSVLENGVIETSKSDYEKAFDLLNENGNVMCIDLSEYKKVIDDGTSYACSIYEYGNTTPTVLFNTKLTGSEIYKLLNIDATFFTKSVENESSKKYSFLCHRFTFTKDWKNYRYKKQ